MPSSLNSLNLFCYLIVTLRCLLCYDCYMSVMSDWDFIPVNSVSVIRCEPILFVLVGSKCWKCVHEAADIVHSNG